MSGRELDNDLFFIGIDAEGGSLTAELVGSKAANLCQMAQLGLKVPPAFVVSTRLCKPINSGDEWAKKQLQSYLDDGISKLERVTGRCFGDPRRPLLVSMRSGAARSMPGMLDTILNVGMTPTTVHGLIRLTGNPRLAWDSYRRFMEAFATVVGHAAHEPFAARLAEMIEAEGVRDEAGLDPEALERLTAGFREEATKALGEPIPDDPHGQLQTAAEAIYRSWESPRAREYRRLNRLEDLTGSAVAVQTMVFGNSGGHSGAGVAFTRNPGNGAKEPYIDFLFDAQGEDVVSGRRKPSTSFGQRLPEVAKTLADGAARLERHFRDMQDIEFTVEEGTLFFLQTRAGKRTPRAALRILIDLVQEEVIDEEEAALRAGAIDFDSAAITRFEGEATPVAIGIPASTGVASGRAVFRSDKAAERATGATDPAILIRPDTSTEDIAGFAAAAGILTASGGRTAHAAVVARQLGKPCIVGCPDLKVDSDGHRAEIGGETVMDGDWILIDGETGEVYLGQRLIVVQRPETEIDQVMRWQSLHREKPAKKGR